MRRIKSFLFWISGKRTDVGVLDILTFMFCPSFSYLGKKKETFIEELNHFYKVSFAGFPSAIYWPRTFPINTLYQVVTELLYKNWWNYEIKENPIDENDCVLDCGAAEGAFSLLNYKKCRKIYAIEPHPTFVDSMKKTFEGLSNIEILPIAVGDIKGTFQLSNEGIMSQVSDEGIIVEIDTIDNLFYHKSIKIDYIKADLEGFELKMLQGAELTIRNWKPKLSITTYHYKDDFKNTFDFLRKICPEYTIKSVGITDQFGTPVMLHAWIS